MDDLPAASAPARAHVAAQAQLRGFLVAALVALWKGLPGYDESDLAAWLTPATGLVLGAQRQAIALVDAFFAASLERQPIGVDPTPLLGAAVRADTPPAEVYRRPFVTLWSGLKEGKDFEKASAAALERATVSAQTDVQLSMRAAVSEIAQVDPEIFGYRRVTDGDACDLCLIASTQRYHVADLLPIHNRCGCGVEAILEPTGRVVDRELYRKLKAEGTIDKLTRQRRASRFRDRAEANRERAEGWRVEAASEDDSARRRRLQKRAERYDARAAAQDAEAEKDQPPVTAEVVEHGELGPVLVNAAHHFKSAADLPAAA